MKKLIFKNQSIKRWVVERTFFWLGHFRRLDKDYKIIRIAMLRLTVAKDKQRGQIKITFF